MSNDREHQDDATAESGRNTADPNRDEGGEAAPTSDPTDQAHIEGDEEVEQATDANRNEDVEGKQTTDPTDNTADQTHTEGDEEVEQATDPTDNTAEQTTDNTAEPSKQKDKGDDIGAAIAAAGGAQGDGDKGAGDQPDVSGGQPNVNGGQPNVNGDQPNVNGDQTSANGNDNQTNGNGGQPNANGNGDQGDQEQKGVAIRSEGPTAGEETWDRTWPREWTTIILALAIMGFGLWIVWVTFWRIDGNGTDTVAFGQRKDIIAIMLGLMGTVTGYFFGRVPAENRAKVAEKQSAEDKELALQNVQNLEEEKQRSQKLEGKVADARDTIKKGLASGTAGAPSGAARRAVLSDDTPPTVVQEIVGNEQRLNDLLDRLEK